MDEADRSALEFLLAFDGRQHFFANGYSVKFEIKEVSRSSGRPHGLKYSFTLHDASNKRILGFDNAHPVPERGSKFKKTPVEQDHWHRTSKDKGTPYAFTSVEQLLDDFEREVKRVLAEIDADADVVRVETKESRDEGSKL